MESYYHSAVSHSSGTETLLSNSNPLGTELNFQCNIQNPEFKFQNLIFLMHTLKKRETVRQIGKKPNRAV